MDLLAYAADRAGVAVLVVLVAGLVVANVLWTFRRAASMLVEALAADGHRLVSREYRWLARGPFFWTTSKSQIVYRFAAADADGVVRSGWARCGSYFFGLLSRRVDIRWDGEQADARRRGFPVVTRNGTRDR